MKINKFLFVALSLFLTGIFTACSSDDDTIEVPQNPDVVNQQYVVAANDSENAYLMTVEDITSGSVSPKNSLQVIGTPGWYFANEIAAYGFVYRQGDPGTTQSFALNDEGELAERNEINLTVSIQSKGLVGDKIYIEYSSRNHEEPTATFYIVDPHSQNVEGPITLDTEELAGNGEYAYITDIRGYNGKVLVGFRTIKAGSDGSEETEDLFGSDFNDHTYLAVFSEDLQLEKVIEDTGRTGVIAGQWRATGETGIEPIENGDVYVFSSALDAEEIPSGILKLNSGEMEFDKDYFFDVTEASDGYKLYRTFYAGDNKFVLQMFSEAGVSSSSPDVTRNKFAVVDVVDQQFEWVSNVPDGILDVGEPFADKETNQVVFPIETSGYPKLYIVDANTADMTEGLEVKAEGVDAIGKLTIQ